MSGGYFEYYQYRITDIVDQLERVLNEQEKLIKSNLDSDTNEDGYLIVRYSDKTIEKFKLTIKELRRVSNMVHRIDWLLSDDDDEDRFHKRWKEENLDRKNHE